MDVAWLVGIVATPIAGALIYCVWTLKELMWMHRHPDKTEFGTAGIKEVIGANTEAFNELRECMKWMTAQMGLQEQPPQLGKRDVRQ